MKIASPIAKKFTKRCRLPGGPEAPPDKAGITLHQLLTHTAGLPESLGPEYEPLARMLTLAA